MMAIEESQSVYFTTDYENTVIKYHKLMNTTNPLLRRFQRPIKKLTYEQNKESEKI